MSDNTDEMLLEALRARHRQAPEMSVTVDVNSGDVIGYLDTHSVIHIILEDGQPPRVFSITQGTRGDFYDEYQLTRLKCAAMEIAMETHGLDAGEINARLTSLE
jgi:hypothetical protein